MRKITYQEYLNKVRGGWIGKCAGGILGAPIEGMKCFNDIELSEKLFETNFPNDDLDLQVLWLDMVKQKGPFVREKDYAEHWLNHVEFPWGEYGLATRNLRLGLYPPASGWHNNWYWKTGMGCPIRSEIWGMLCPGMPEKAAFYAEIDATLDHEGFSVDAEKFLSACAAEAFFESDVETIFKTVIKLFPKESEITELVETVIKWFHESGFEITMGKIKSYWGDADFTYAPMNVGFTILALLHAKGEFSGIMPALHCGHDSDCVVATAGALIGIINGYENISKEWKKLVGDELLVSPEITGIKHADTISGLAEETCKSGISFVNELKGVAFEGEVPAPYNIQKNEIHINAFPVQKTYSLGNSFGSIQVDLENLSTNTKEISLEIASEFLAFPSSVQSISLNAGEKKSIEVQFNMLNSDSTQPSLSYRIEAKVNGENQTYEFGIPNYGSWLLLGPFIEDDKSLVPMDPKYPDHGLASLPSVKYMNHDKVNLDKDFVSVEEARSISQSEDYSKLPFHVQKIFPGEGKMNLNQYFKGKGEKSIYLYSKVNLEEAQQRWVAMGCSAFCKVWINGKLAHEQKEIQRSWPAAITFIIQLNKGENDVLIKIDMPVDQVDFEFGFKEFLEKHPHQSQWDKNIVPTV